jgi:anhydro-N-acetylmuramic acid kinase
VLVGEAFAAAISASAGGLELDLIGSHGQTIYHYSRLPGAMRTTLQIGDGDTIAERLGVPVVSDFRSRDIAAGGEGAPLTPYADFVLFGGRSGVAVLNLGGIANITLLGSRLEDVAGFDTGPANAPLDRIARSEFGMRFDREGELARSGVHHPGIARRMVEADLYVQQAPPKSTGTEAYGDGFIGKLRAETGQSGSDLLRLATEFVAESIACQVPPGVEELILAGGGAANTFLHELLEARLTPCRVSVSDAYGVPAQAREAMAFAILANDAVCGLPTSLPRVTGAKHARTLGKFSLP